MGLIYGALGRDEEENGALDENAVSKLLEEVLVEAGINPQTPEGWLHPPPITPSISLWAHLHCTWLSTRVVSCVVCDWGTASARALPGLGGIGHSGWRGQDCALSPHHVRSVL